MNLLALAEALITLASFIGYVLLEILVEAGFDMAWYRTRRGRESAGNECEPLRPEVQFSFPSWLCLAFVTGMVASAFSLVGCPAPIWTTPWFRAANLVFSPCLVGALLYVWGRWSRASWLPSQGFWVGVVATLSFCAPRLVLVAV